MISFTKGELNAIESWFEIYKKWGKLPSKHDLSAISKIHDILGTTLPDELEQDIIETIKYLQRKGIQSTYRRIVSKCVKYHGYDEKLITYKLNAMTKSKAFIVKKYVYFDMDGVKQRVRIIVLKHQKEDFQEVNEAKARIIGK